MEKEYFYLDGKEQKGPFKISHFQNIDIKPDTLFWTEGLENWLPAKDIDEIRDLIRKTPPPPPIIDNSTNASDYDEENKEKKHTIVEDSNVKFWASFKIFLFVIVLIGISTLLSFWIIQNLKDEYKSEIYQKINSILEGKTVVLDGNLTLTEGGIEDTKYKSTSKSESFFTPWYERDKIYTVYKASRGGFTIKQLTQQYQDGYDIETHTSGDLGYKKPKYRYVAPQYIDDYWGGGKTKISDGYRTKNYRLSVRECYREAYDFFTVDDKKSPGSYSPGKYVDITNFPEIWNKFFYMSNREPIQYTSSGMFSSNWYTSDEHGANINTDDWAVYYSTYGKHYVITENKTAINEILFTYLGISLGVIFLLLIILKSSKPKYFRNLRLFGKRWKNTSFKEQVLFFDHSFFRKNTFTEIVDSNVNKGSLKITDKGSTLHLSFLTKELFYKIDKIEKDNLTLISLKDNSEISFVRVGAKTATSTSDRDTSENQVENQEPQEDDV